MYSSSTHLFRRSLATDLRDRLEQIRLTISRADLDRLDKITPDSWNVVVPTLVRDEIEFDPSDSGSKVHVTVTVPVTGDERLLELAPEGLGRHEQIAIRLTDDLGWIRDREVSGNSYSSSGWSDADQTVKPRHGGFVFSRSFDSKASGNEVRAWATKVVDWVEEVLRATASQVEDFNSLRRSSVSKWIEERRMALGTAESLRGELGRGL